MFICKATDISFDRPYPFSLDDRKILILKAKDGTFYACDAYCTHADKSMEKGKWDNEKKELTCPFHKAVFALGEGGAVKAPPAYVPIALYPIEVRNKDDGTPWLFVAVS